MTITSSAQSTSGTSSTRVRKRGGRPAAPLLAALVSACLAGVALGAQDGTRQIWDSGFKQQRPTKPAPAPPSDSSRPGRAAPPQTARATRIIGFTLWRLRAPRTAENAPRLLVQDTGVALPTEFVADRLQSNAALRVGDRVRLGIEVSSQGFLYVINRERYTDGTRGRPRLMFPTRNLRGGDNRIEPGRLIEIPGQSDRIPALVVQRNDARYLGEELLIVVTPRPIDDLTIGEKETPLDAARVAQWERDWSRPAQQVNVAAEVTTADRWTTAEQAAGRSERLLTQDDPLPASLFEMALGRDGGVLVHVPLAVE